MRGSPLRDSLVTGVALGLMAVPLWSVTRPRTFPTAEKASQDRAQEPEGNAVPTEVILRSAHRFDSVAISSNGRDYDVPSGIAAVVILPDDPSSLTVHAIWPEGTPETALLVEISPRGKSARSQTLWGLGEAFETIVSPAP